MSAAADDPFGEDTAAHLHARLSVLGGEFAVTTSARRLLDLAIEAFGGLPSQRLGRRVPRFSVRLVLNERQRTWDRGDEPPPPMFSSGAGLLCATIDAGNFAVVDVGKARALISVSKAMLEQPYYPRYELVELVFLTLASRGQALVPLHAACVGTNGNGVLLVGGSGTGKSTLCLHALDGGMQLLSEDSAFVARKGLRVTGVSNYLHLAHDAPGFLRPGALRRAIERSPVIHRRSGARKFELDLRTLRAEAAREPLRLVATVFLSRRAASGAQALRMIDRDACIARLRREQPYARHTFPGWSAFEGRLAFLPSYELRRTQHPAIAVRQLRELL
jgi:hypothetical protein